MGEAETGRMHEGIARERAPLTVVVPISHGCRFRDGYLFSRTRGDR